ncbi:hypothetical protein J132_09507 [Termitomyces sp. J132]|nr:hypothetical protein J132_09507 [Termitomyces sp. J132]
MRAGKESRDRSVSGDLEDSEPESPLNDDSTNPPGKPGRKKNPNSQAARRDQNRIAQREFRLRKQQRACYHLDNYKRNNQYCLPSSLRPSIVQRTIPHESVIDGILHAELRDRMILLRSLTPPLDRYDLVECLIDYRRSVTIHGDDVLAHSNWEIGEKFLRQYGYLIDQATLAIANRWRKERGEPEIRLSDIGSSENTPPA